MAGKAFPNPGLIHWLTLHGHGVGHMAGDGFQVAAPALLWRQAASVFGDLHPLGIFWHRSSAELAAV
ncbi:MAG: hypothetical protein F4026_08340 [Synechococcus sp. SB0669_bin_8]|nr:hypothetical protein [Synechococcus sp. SB0669_bin_8]